MKLFLYFARYYLGVVLLVQGGLVVIVVATTLVENAGYLARQDAGALSLALNAAAEFGHMVFPVACLLATIVAGTLLARSGEVLAVLAAGVSARRIASGFAAVVLLVALVGGVVGEVVVPRARARFDKLQRREPMPTGQPFGRYYDRHTQWFREGELLLYLPSYDYASESFGDVVIYRLREGLVASVTDAARMFFRDGSWWLERAREYRVDGARSTSREIEELALGVGPKDLIEVIGDASSMRSAEIMSFRSRRAKAGLDVAPFAIELHGRAAHPLTALLMFLLVVPWSLDANRRRSLAVNMGVGVLAVSFLLSLTYVFRLLALSHKIPAPLGAWGINLACLGLAPLSFALYQRYRRRGSLW